MSELLELCQRGTLAAGVQTHQLLLLKLLRCCCTFRTTQTALPPTLCFTGPGSCCHQARLATQHWSIRSKRRASVVPSHQVGASQATQCAEFDAAELWVQLTLVIQQECSHCRYLRCA